MQQPQKQQSLLISQTPCTQTVCSNLQTQARSNQLQQSHHHVLPTVHPPPDQKQTYLMNSMSAIHGVPFSTDLNGLSKQLPKKRTKQTKSVFALQQKYVQNLLENRQRNVANTLKRKQVHDTARQGNTQSREFHVQHSPMAVKPCSSEESLTAQIYSEPQYHPSRTDVGM